MAFCIVKHIEQKWPEYKIGCNKSYKFIEGGSEVNLAQRYSTAY